MKSRGSYWIGFTAISLALFIGTGSILASRPDMDLKLSREVKSDLDTQTLGYSMKTLAEWPKWFASLDSVETVDLPGNKSAQTGAILKLHMNPKRGPWSKFDVLVRILDFKPNESIRMQVIDDSQHKLTLLFDHLEWQVSLSPNAKGTLVRGSVEGHTSHWRARIIGQLFEHILMNQVFYPDIIHLALMDKPEPTNPFSD